MNTTDAEARHVALTDFESILCVEAAAGTGKTSLLAGRVALMLASGIPPRDIVAVTFTEAAAAEIAAKIEETVDALLADDIPPALRPALTDRLGPNDKGHLLAAKDSLNELVATTIHGFCLIILKAHAVDCGLDPGARILDAPAAEALFRSEVDNWLEERLGPDGVAGDPVAVLAERAPLDVARIYRNLARMRREHRSAVASDPDLLARPDIDLEEAVDELRRWTAKNSSEQRATAVARELGRLIAPYSTLFASPPAFDALWTMANPPPSSLFEWKGHRLEGFQTVLDEIGGRDEFAQISPEGQRLYERCSRCWLALQGHITRCLLAQIYGSVDEVLERYETRKRLASLLDFDDLILKTRKLLRGSEPARRTVGRAHPRILVDEFQDSDPIQIEIMFAIAADGPHDDWSTAKLRPGSLFVVGDPKQTIYRFRGADTATYLRAKRAIEHHPGGAVLQVRANYRSQKGILDYVNAYFSEPLAKHIEYVPLEHTVEEYGTLPKAARLTINAEGNKLKAGELRDLEAGAVADLCSRLIGNYSVKRRDGSLAAIRPGDIALLTPTHTELWRYERALEERRIPTASEAGTNLMLRQETQDVVALVRVLASSRDLLAFGALMRGPLVGLTDQELLDIQTGLPAGTRLTVNTDPALVQNDVARDIIERLQRLRRLCRKTMPAVALSTAIEELHVRIVLSYRHRQREARALANVDALIERARSYEVRGFTQFAQDLSRDWQERSKAAEGRIDASGHAVSILTIHGSKGLEWPVVIQINSVTQFMPSDSFVYSAEENTIHWALGQIEHPDTAEARRLDELAEQRQRERLWYVACTRARDLLVVPRLRGAKSSSWHDVVDLGREGLHELDLDGLPPPAPAQPVKEENIETKEHFVRATEAIAEVARPTIWRRPSDEDRDRPRSEMSPIVIDDIVDHGSHNDIAGAGAGRGRILHKMMELVLLGVLMEDRADLERAAKEMTLQVFADQAAEEVPDAVELAETVLRTLRLEIVARNRSKLVPELAIWARQADAEHLVRGRADAMVVSNDQIELVIDWKSDITITPSQLAGYRDQLNEYMRATGAKRGALVFMTSSQVVDMQVTV